MRRLVATITLAILAVAVLAGCGPTLITPNVVGLPLDKAHQAFEALGIKEFDDKDAFENRNAMVDSNWAVLGQDPAAGTTVDTDIKIKLTIGKIGEDRTTARLTEGSPVLAKIRAEAAAKAVADKAAANKAAATKTAESSTDGQEGDGTHFTYGHSASYSFTPSHSPSVPLEVIVSAPTAFTPSGAAEILDQRAEYAVVKGTWQETNVYFTVTLKNLSNTETYNNDFTFSDVHKTTTDDSVGEVSDDGIEGTTGLRDIGPGKSITFKDGYSVKSADNIQYEIKFDGLIGKTFYFAK